MPFHMIFIRSYAECVKTDKTLNHGLASQEVTGTHFLFPFVKIAVYQFYLAIVELAPK